MTMWFDRKPGDTVSVGSEEDGDPSTLLLASTDALPDWIKAPSEIGGQKLRVIRAFTSPCPMCKDENLVRHIECSEAFFVAECTVHGFAWYKKRAT